MCFITQIYLTQNAELKIRGTTVHAIRKAFRLFGDTLTRINNVPHTGPLVQEARAAKGTQTNRIDNIVDMEYPKIVNVMAPLPPTETESKFWAKDEDITNCEKVLDSFIYIQLCSAMWRLQ